MHYRKGEVQKIIPMEFQMMDETGDSRASIHKKAIKLLYNTRQKAKLQMAEI